MRKKLAAPMCIPSPSLSRGWSASNSPKPFDNADSLLKSMRPCSGTADGDMALDEARGSRPFSKTHRRLVETVDLEAALHDWKEPLVNEQAPRPRRETGDPERARGLHTCITCLWSENDRSPLEAARAEALRMASA